MPPELEERLAELTDSTAWWTDRWLPGRAGNVSPEELWHFGGPPGRAIVRGWARFLVPREEDG